MDKLNRDNILYLCENYLDIADAGHLAHTCKQIYFTPTKKMLFQKGIIYCVERGLLDLLNKFENPKIDTKLFQAAIINNQWKAGLWIANNITNLNVKYFLEDELCFALQKNNKNRVSTILKIITHMKYHFHDFNSILGDALYYSDLKIVITICRHFNLIQNSQLLTRLAIDFERLDMLRWVASTYGTKIITSEIVPCGLSKMNITTISLILLFLLSLYLYKCVYTLPVDSSPQIPNYDYLKIIDYDVNEFSNLYQPSVNCVPSININHSDKIHFLCSDRSTSSVYTVHVI